MQTRTRSWTPAGLAAASAGVFVWAAGVVIIKSTTSHFLVVALWKHLIGLPVLTAAWLLARDRTLPLRAGILGGLLFAVHQFANFGALRHAPASVVTVLFSLQPIVVGVAGGRFTGEEATKRFFVWALVAAGGCGLLIAASTRDAETTLLGIALSVLNLAAWSSYYIATKRARARYGTAPWLLVMTVTSTVCMVLLVAITGQSFAMPRGRELGLIAVVAIIPGVFGHLLVTWAQPRIHVAASSSLILGVPVFGSIGAWIFVGEPFGPIQGLGGLIALIGAAAAMRHLPQPVTAEAAGRYGEVAS